MCQELHNSPVKTLRIHHHKLRGIHLRNFMQFHLWKILLNKATIAVSCLLFLLAVPISDLAAHFSRLRWQSRPTESANTHSGSAVQGRNSSVFSCSFPYYQTLILPAPISFLQNICNLCKILARLLEDGQHTVAMHHLRAGKCGVGNLSAFAGLLKVRQRTV